MAPGYLIALCLDGAGTLGVALGLWVLHAERRAKAAELARFLRSGQSGETVAARPRSVPQSRPAPPVRVRTPAHAADLAPSSAVLALRSAFTTATR